MVSLRRRYVLPHYYYRRRVQWAIITFYMHIADATCDLEVRCGAGGHLKSGLRRACSTSPIEIHGMALMPCPSLLSVPTLVGHFYSLNTILQPPHTTRR